MKTLVTFGALFLMVGLASCVKMKEYTYVETVRRPLLLGGGEVEKEAEIIRAPDDSTAFVQAFEQYCIALHVYDCMDERFAGVRDEPVSLALYNGKGEVVRPEVSLETLDSMRNHIFSLPVDSLQPATETKGNENRNENLERRTMTKEELMREAIRLSVENVAQGGGPFGAVIVRDGEVVATGVNRVTASCDPTAHAEVSAIRAAAARLGTFDLSGCEIYSSCEPCPMCLGAIYWARLDRLYYAGDRNDAERAGFDDSMIYREIVLDPSERQLHTERLLGDEALAAFEAWRAKEDRTDY